MQTRKMKVLLAVVLVVLIAAACGGDAEQPDAGDDGEAPAAATYDDNGVTFEYPADWDEFPAEAAATSTGSNEIWSATVGPDKTNLVNVTAYQLNLEVNEENFESIETELDQVIQDVVDQAGGEITAGPDPDEIAGYLAYTYRWEGVEVDDEPKDSSAYFLFAGDVEYFFNCQYSDDTVEEIQAGCDQVLSSFEVTEES